MSDQFSVMYTKEFFLQDNICRFCWAKNAMIECKGVLNNHFLFKVEYCLNIDLSQDDSEYCPKYACQNCFDKIEQFHDFKSFCQNTNEKLSVILNYINIETEDTELEVENFDGNRDRSAIDINFEDENFDMSIDTSMIDINLEDENFDDTLDTSAKDIKLKQVKLENENLNGSSVESKASKDRPQCPEFNLWENIEELPKNTKTNEESSSKIEIKVEKVDNLLTCIPSTADVINCLQKTEYTIKNESIKLSKRLKQWFTYCNICCENFSDEEAFVKHNSLEHGLEIDGRFKCYGCGKLYSKKQYRAEHENICQELENGYKCSLCKKYLFTRLSYEKHMKCHRLKNKLVDFPDDNLFVCSKCGKQFPNKEDWKAHKKEHIPTYVCETCGRAFAKRAYLNVHEVTHTGAKRYACTECGHRCAQKQALNSHMRTHTKEKPYQCDICPLRCSTSSNLQKHRQMVHLRLKSFECPYSTCDKKFGYSASLKEHVATIHEGETTSNPCPYCSSVYRRRNHLIRHLHKKHPDKYQGMKNNRIRIITEASNSDTNEISSQETEQPVPAE